MKSCCWAKKKKKKEWRLERKSCWVRLLNKPIIKKKQALAYRMQLNMHDIEDIVRRLQLAIGWHLLFFRR